MSNGDHTRGPVDPGPAVAAEDEEEPGGDEGVEGVLDDATMETAEAQVLEADLRELDAFEMAVVSLGEADEQVRKGVELAVGALSSALERHGLARIADLDVPFDPNQHEAVMQDDGDGEPRVGDVLRTGYALNGRVVRPAMVKVTRAGEASE
jgi:molecular chaperone GrpE (heat shock protein)